MRYRTLGRTGLKISALSLGTVSLGVDYGIEAPNQFGCPRNVEALGLIAEAVNSGITLFDTAPNYGESERLLGKAIKNHPDCLIATKVPIPRNENKVVLSGKPLSEFIEKSLRRSLEALQRDTLDIVQIHNASEDVLKHGEMAENLLRFKEKGLIQCIGASVYTEDEALAILSAGCFDVLQVAYSILDRRMEKKVFPAAKERGVTILTRSALLKGALTYKAQWLPKELSELKNTIENIKEEATNGSWEQLQETAIRFCLSSPHIDSVLIGPRNRQELQFALASQDKGLLPKELLKTLSTFQLQEERLLNPSLWPVQ